MSQELNAFFAKIMDDKNLQEQLHSTKEISDAALIAKNLGFTITGAEILQAQAHRVLTLVPHELERLAAGGKVNSAANWGRDGNGYLDNAGFWVVTFVRWNDINESSEQKIVDFLHEIIKNKDLEEKVLNAKNHIEVAKVASEYGYDISGIDLLRYQLEQILKLNNEKMEMVASGKI